MSFENGNKYYNEGKLELAIEQYKESIGRGYEAEMSYYNMGIAYIKLEEFDKAIHCMEKAISFEMENKYFYSLGYCYYMKKDCGSALFNFIIASKLDEEDLATKEAVKTLIEVIQKMNKEN